MSTQPFLPLFFGDLLAATPTWDGEERALYMLLLAYQWSAGPLPADPKRLAKMCQYEAKTFAKLWEVVGRKFVVVDGGLINERLEEHRVKAQQVSDRRKTSGENGAASKWSQTPSKTPGKTRSERLAEARKLGRHSDAEWGALVVVCGDSCVKCGIHKSEVNGDALCKDHIRPIYAGGSDAIENIQPMCRNCNSSKGPDDSDYRPTDWKERLAKRLANGCHPSHPIPIQSPEEDSRRGGDATSVDKALYADAREIFGKSIGGQVSKAIKFHGKPWLLGVIEACRGKDSEGARAYFAAAMNGAHKPGEAEKRKAMP